MIARFIVLILIAVLALPVSTLPRPAEPSPSPWSDLAVAAKGKKHKKAKKSKPKTVTRTVRETVTQTFTSTVPLTVPMSGQSDGPANPYPATIDVSGYVNGAITDVNVVLEGFTHMTPRDVDILLTAADGRRALVMSDTGAGAVGIEDAVVDLELTLDDEAATPLTPVERLVDGTFQPANYQPAADADTFAAPAPTPDGNVALRVFDGADPNGTWQLWVMDDIGADTGDLGGWALQITAEVDVQVEEPVKAKNKRHKQKGKGGKKGRN